MLRAGIAGGRPKEDGTVPEAQLENVFSCLGAAFRCLQQTIWHGNKYKERRYSNIASMDM
jgi:hypothetical protein